jgi:hypothetical protein
VFVSCPQTRNCVEKGLSAKGHRVARENVIITEVKKEVCEEEETDKMEFC